MSFGERLKRIRLYYRITQADLAALVGINQVSLCRLERGQREPSWRLVQAFAKVLCVPCDNFADESVAMSFPRASTPKKRGRPFTKTKKRSKRCR